MSEQCILVSGGAGYVGSHSLIELVNAGCSVVVLDNFVNASHGMLLDRHRFTTCKRDIFLHMKIVGLNVLMNRR